MSTTQPIQRQHLRRLKEIYRSSGWPCRDGVEVELRVAGLIEAREDEVGRETLRLTTVGLEALAGYQASSRASRSAHDALVEQVAQAMQREGRVVWTGLPLRAQVDGEWVVAIPDVFSIRHTTVESYLQPVVHEIKVSRADLLCDLKRPEKRGAYLGMAQQVYYVLGLNAKGQPIAEPEEIPAECGVMVATATSVEVARMAPAQPFGGMRFDTWMALAKASPLARGEEASQLAL